MRTKITDEDALRALSWVDLKAYLDSQGWRAAGTYAGKAAIYASPSDNGGTAEILVPLNDDVADYAARMADAVAALARIEDRDEQAIFSDLSEAGSDVIRLRASEADDEGTISLADGVALHREAENLMLAAACAAVEPRRSYHARKIAEVRDYLDELRLGQTERGSYVMTIRSPISPALRSSRLELFDAMAALLDDDGGEPFSRRVTLKLARALASTKDAVSKAIADDGFDAFDAAVDHGVSANLCDAIASLAQHGAGLDIGISWARVRPVTGANPHFRFSRDMARVLQEAAVEFRRNEPRLDERVEGFVIHLDRPPEQFDGHATLRTLIDGKQRRIQVTFDQGEYNLVIRAHRDQVAVSLDGGLYPRGQRWELRNPRNLRLLTEAEDDLLGNAQRTP